MPGLPKDDAPEPTWVDLAIEHGRRSKELELKRSAERQEAEEAAAAPKTTAGIIRQAIALNSDELLNAAAEAVGGTVYDRGNSIAAFIEGEIQRGRNE